MTPYPAPRYVYPRKATLPSLPALPTPDGCVARVAEPLQVVLVVEVITQGNPFLSVNLVVHVCAEPQTRAPVYRVLAHGVTAQYRAASVRTPPGAVVELL
jgi:hypothetical protein